MIEFAALHLEELHRAGKIAEYNDNDSNDILSVNDTIGDRVVTESDLKSYQTIEALLHETSPDAAIHFDISTGKNFSDTASTWTTYVIYSQLGDTNKPQGIVGGREHLIPFHFDFWSVGGMKYHEPQTKDCRKSLQYQEFEKNHKMVKTEFANGNVHFELANSLFNSAFDYVADSGFSTLKSPTGFEFCPKLKHVQNSSWMYESTTPGYYRATKSAGSVSAKPKGYKPNALPLHADPWPAQNIPEAWLLNDDKSSK